MLRQLLLLGTIVWTASCVNDKPTLRQQQGEIWLPPREAIELIVFDALTEKPPWGEFSKIKEIHLVQEIMSSRSGAIPLGTVGEGWPSEIKLIAPSEKKNHMHYIHENKEQPLIIEFYAMTEEFGPQIYEVPVGWWSYWGMCATYVLRVDVSKGTIQKERTLSIC